MDPPRATKTQTRISGVPTEELTDRFAIRSRKPSKGICSRSNTSWQERSERNGTDSNTIRYAWRSTRCLLYTVDLIGNNDQVKNFVFSPSCKSRRGELLSANAPSITRKISESRSGDFSYSFSCRHSIQRSIVVFPMRVALYTGFELCSSGMDSRIPGQTLHVPQRTDLPLPLPLMICSQEKILP